MGELELELRRLRLIDSINRLGKVFNYVFRNIILRSTYLLRVEYHVVDHCNLNCKACAHYSNISPKTFRDLKQFEKDISCLASKVSIGEFRIMGGEPLLHPELIKFLGITRKYLPKSKITLCTNCILLKKMPDKFWGGMRKYKIGIEPTVYPPLKSDFDSILKLIRKNKIRVTHIHLADEFSSCTNRQGTSNAVESHMKCGERICHHLRDGRMYLCPHNCYIDYYNSYFNEDMPRDSGVDIYASSGRDIVDYVMSVKDVCRYCTTKGKIFRWEQSKRLKDEWDGCI